MKAFAYERATRVRDALVAGHAGARYLGGGTNLVDLMKDGVEAPTRLVDVRHLPLDGVHVAPDGGLVIGATTTNSDVAAHPEVRRRYPALSQALLAGASGQLRNMATVGGNLLQRTRCAYFADPSAACGKRVPGSGCSAVAGAHHNHAVLGWSEHCVATHPSDMAVALAAFDAVVHYETLDGAGEIPLSDFYPPVGDTPWRETTLPPGALITAVALPESAALPRSRYRKVRERASYAFATVSVAVALDVQNGQISGARIALGGVASRPWRARAAEDVLLGGPATAERFQAAADAALANAAPLPGNGYKVTLARNLVAAVLAEVSGVRTHEWDSRAHEWDFREGPGSKTGGSLVAMEVASGGAGRRRVISPAVGTPRPRLEGRAKVTGGARYAADEPMPGLAHGWVVLSTVSSGRVRDIDDSAALGMPGVLGVLDHRNAPRLAPGVGMFFGPDGGMQLLQDDLVPHAGRPVALVVAETPEQAKAAADALVVTYDEQPHDTAFSAGHPAVRPVVTPWGEEADVGDVDAELAAAAVVVDERYRTPEEHCAAMEPHAAVAWWDGDRLQAVDSNQGPFAVAGVVAALFSLTPQQVRIRAEHVGGGFGSKGLCGPQLILAVMATTRFERPVRVTLTRDQVFLATAMRPPIDQRVRLGAGADGRLRAIHHEATFAVSPLAAYIEGCTELSKTLYAAPAIRTGLFAVPLDILPPYSMRGPGATPGSFALESAMDELADRLGIDPLELRLRNEPAAGPVSGLPFSGRNLVACLTEGARRFGWAGRDHRPRTRREGHLPVGTGMAATSFSNGAFPSTAAITAETDGTFTVAIGATDIGTGARTALVAVAADALGVDTGRIRITISDSDHGPVWSAGGSRGTTSWTWAVTEAAAGLRDRLGDPARPVTVTADTTQLLGDLPTMERHAYSAVFTEVTVDPATGEVRVRRLLGMFAVGRVINPLLARSQVVGGMIGGLSMALHEEGVRDPASGRQVNADFAGYHIAAHADVPDIEADFVPDHEPGIPLGIKGAGEIGNVGTAAAIANAVWHATGVRHRTLPIRLDRVVE